MIKGDSRIRVRSLRKCRATVARGATRSLFACASRGLPGHLRCGFSTSPKTQVKCIDFKLVVACLEKTNFPRKSGISHSFSLEISMVIRWDRPPNFSILERVLVQHVVYLLNATTQSSIPLPAYGKVGSYIRGSLPGVHVPLEVHLPIRAGTFKVRNRREIYIYVSLISKYLYI